MFNGLWLIKFELYLFGPFRKQSIHLDLWKPCPKSGFIKAGLNLIASQGKMSCGNLNRCPKHLRISNASNLKTLVQCNDIWEKTKVDACFTHNSSRKVKVKGHVIDSPSRVSENGCAERCESRPFIIAILFYITIISLPEYQKSNEICIQLCQIISIMECHFTAFV